MPSCSAGREEGGEEGGEEGVRCNAAKGCVGAAGGIGGPLAFASWRVGIGVGGHWLSPRPTGTVGGHSGAPAS